MLGSFIGGLVGKLATWLLSVYGIFRAGKAAQRSKDTEVTVKILDEEAKAGAEAHDTAADLGKGTF